MNKNESVIDWVLIAKGIGIILVVFGHFSPHDLPDYWREMRKIVYAFHMPLFFMLSGFLYSHAKYSYSMLIKIKVKRLLYPFISIAVIFFIIKNLSGIFFYLEHPIKLEGVYALIITPMNSYLPLLWFVHALFLIFLVYPLLRNVLSNNVVILIIFVLVNVFWGHNFPVIGKALYNIPYFIVGVILRENATLRCKIISWKWIHVCVSMVLFALVYILIDKMIDFLRNNVQIELEYFFKLMLGMSGAICVINISILIKTKTNIGIKSALLANIGYYSMTIYLFHTLFISAVRVGFDQILVDFNVNFEVIALTAVTAGVIFPFLLEKLVFRKNGFTKKYILGLT